jgi:hypothetical protein
MTTIGVITPLRARELQTLTIRSILAAPDDDAKAALHLGLVHMSADLDMLEAQAAGRHAPFLITGMEAGGIMSENYSRVCIECIGRQLDPFTWPAALDYEDQGPYPASFAAELGHMLGLQDTTEPHIFAQLIARQLTQIHA